MSRTPLRRSAPLPCPMCGADYTIGITHRGRPKNINGTLWRGHECRACGHRFVSIQRVATPDEIAEAS